MTKKLYALIVCIAMLIVSVASVPAHAIAANYVSFTDKIIFENEIYSASDYSTLALNEQEIPESVSVTLRFEESFTCEHESFDNFDQVLELDEREREIIELRYGMGGRRELTQKEVAERLGISQSYISRLEKKIIAKLREEIESEY